MEAVYPASASALSRGRRARRAAPRHRHRTTPVTFAEIKEVDEDSDEALAAREERRRQPDVLAERLDERASVLAERIDERASILTDRLGRQWDEFRRRRARAQLLRELSPPHPSPPSPPSPPRAPSSHPPLTRAGSMPATLYHDESPTPET